MTRSLQVLVLVVALIVSCSFLQSASARTLNDDIQANSQQKFKFALPPKPHHHLPTLPSLPGCSPPPPPCSPPASSPPYVAPPTPYVAPPSPVYSSPPYSPSPTYKSPPASGY